MSGTSKRAPPPLKAAKPAIYPRPGPNSAGLPPTMQKGPSVDALMGVFQPQPQQRSHLVPHRETAPITDRATEEAAQTVKKQLSAPAELRQSSQGQSTTSLASSLAFFEDPPAHMSDVSSSIPYKVQQSVLKHQDRMYWKSSSSPSPIRCAPWIFKKSSNDDAGKSRTPSGPQARMVLLPP